MKKWALLGLFCFFSTVPLGETIKCYHCYERYNSSLVSESNTNSEFGDKFVPCDKLQSKWNVWDCPSHWPVCVIMSGTVKNQNEIVRSCGERDFCSKYVPPAGVKMETCRECENNLCNDFTQLPIPPDGPLFTFNININLNMKKYPKNSEKESL